MDAEGYLWNCRYFGGCVLRISPTGEIDRVIKMPVSNITHCCFGGPDMQMLYITTSSLDNQETSMLEDYFRFAWTLPVRQLAVFSYKKKLHSASNSAPVS